jgi:glycosyltransferase involved in cell wall biosynthesis
MNILFLLDALVMGGKERRSVELIKHLSANPKIKITLCVMDENIHYKEVYSLPIKIHLLLRKTKKDPSVFFKLYKICKDEHIQIIHAWDTMTCFYAAPLSLLLGTKLVDSSVSEATSCPFLSAQYLLRKYNFSLASIVLSNSRAGLVMSKAPEKKSDVIYNGFDANRLHLSKSPEEVRNEYNIKTKYIVGMVAAFQDRKDFQSLVITANQILNKRQDTTFLLVGAGKTLEECRKLVEPQFQSQIIFTGGSNKVEDFINVFDVGILLTNKKVHAEGISNSILEYMALGKPVIATDSGGTCEIVQNGTSGYILDENTPDVIEDKIAFLLNNDTIRLEMGRASRQIVNDKFGIDVMVKKYVEVYEEILI